MVRVVRVLVLLGLLLVQASGSAHAQSCTGTTCTYTRNVTIWFGTLTVVGVSAANVDVVQLTDTISGTLANAIAIDPAQDTRVRNGLGPWLDNSITDMDWVTAPSQNLPAQQKLLDAFAAAAASLNAAHGPGTLTILPSALNNGPVVYTLTTWATTQNDLIINNIGNANVTAFEQNAIWTAPGAAVSIPTLTPLMVGVMASLLLVFGLRAMRRRPG